MRSLHNFFKHVYSLDVFSLSRKCWYLQEINSKIYLILVTQSTPRNLWMWSTCWRPLTSLLWSAMIGSSATSPTRSPAARRTRRGGTAGSWPPCWRPSWSGTRTSRSHQVHWLLSLVLFCREVFERECSGYPGFITKFRVTDKSSQGNADTDTVDFENFRFVFLLKTGYWTNSVPVSDTCATSGITKLPRLWWFV